MTEELEKLSKDEKVCGIYKIVSPSNRVYIGQSINCLKRFKDYKLYNKTGSQKRLKNSFDKYGKENHIFEIIEECSIDLLNEKERYWQEYYDVLNKNGLNCKLTNTKDKSGKLSKELVDKISKANTGKKRSDAFKMKMSVIKKGKKLPLSTVEAIKNGHKNNPKSKEWKTNQGKINSKEVFCFNNDGNLINSYYSVREAGRELNISFDGIIYSIKTKKIYKNYFWSYSKSEDISLYRFFRKGGLSVNMYSISNEFIKTFETITEASKQTNIIKSSIIRCCKNKQKTAGGFIFKYKVNENI